MLCTSHDSWSLRGWISRAANIVSIQRRIHAHGMVVLLPDLVDLGQYIDLDHPDIAPLVQNAVKAAGLDYFDLVDAFRPYREHLLQIRDPGLRHPNPEGYRVIADTLANEIDQRYLDSSNVVLP